MSIDPVTFTGSGGDPRHFNRYSYGFNDPVNLTDSTGMSPLRDMHYSKMSTGGRLPAGMKPAGTPVTGTVRGDLLMTAGAAIVAFDVLTIPSGEGAAGVAMMTAARGIAVDAGVGVATDATINVIDQVVQADGDLSQTDFAAAASATLENAPESALGGIIGGSAGRKLDGAISPLKGNADHFTGDAMTDAVIGAVENHGSTFLGSVGGSVAANELLDEEP